MAAQIKIDCRPALRQLTKDLDRLKRRQIPFATALALTETANDVRAAELEGLKETFDRPTPFTMRAFGVRSAKKSDLRAIVYARDIQAAYLAPYEGGGRQVLGSKRGVLVPKNVRLNAYGNLPKGKLQQLKGQKDVFVGTIVGKGGAKISGVWKRLPVPKGGKGAKGNSSSQGGGQPQRLQLLIRFSDPVEVKQHLKYAERARGVVDKRLAIHFEAALAKALATAKP